MKREREREEEEEDTKQSVDELDILMLLLIWHSQQNVVVRGLV